MAQIFTEQKIREYVYETVCKSYNSLYDWLAIFCRDYELWDQSNKHVRPYPEELTYLIRAISADIHFIKSITTFHQLHLLVLSKRLDLYIISLLNSCKRPWDIQGVDVICFYRNLVIGIILALFKNTEEKDIFYLGCDYFPHADILLAWETNISEVNDEVLDDFTALIAFPFDYSRVWRYAEVYWAINEYTKENPQNEDQIEELRKKIESLMSDVKELKQKPREIHNHFNDKVGQYAQNIERQELNT